MSLESQTAELKEFAANEKFEIAQNFELLYNFYMSTKKTVAFPSPVKTDPDKYKVIFENERVRVFDYRDEPGDKTKMHHHKDFVLYALSSFKRRLTFPDGKSVVREFEGGEILWSDEQSHIGENIGATNTHVLIVELKEKASRAYLNLFFALSTRKFLNTLLKKA